MDYTLHEWVRMASHHGSIARCAIEKQAEESGLDALAVREKMRHHLRVMQLRRCHHLHCTRYLPRAVDTGYAGLYFFQ